MQKGSLMKHKFFIKGSVCHQYDNEFSKLKGHVIVELEEDEVETKFINLVFINEILSQFGLYQYSSYDVKECFVAKLDIVNKL